jgi:hypothetical protein
LAGAADPRPGSKLFTPLCGQYCGRFSSSGILAILMAMRGASSRVDSGACGTLIARNEPPFRFPQKKILQDEFPIAVSKRRREPGTLFRRHESLVRLRL